MIETILVDFILTSIVCVYVYNVVRLPFPFIFPSPFPPPRESSRVESIGVESIGRSSLRFVVGLKSPAKGDLERSFSKQTREQTREEEEEKNRGGRKE